MEDNLRRLRDLKNFEVAKNDPDVRGWDVKTSTGRSIGEVKELIVDPDARKVRYLEVGLNRDEAAGRERRDITIPIEAADIDRRDKAVRVDGYAGGADPAAGTASLLGGGYAGERAQTDEYGRGERDWNRSTALPPDSAPVRPTDDLRTDRLHSGDVVVGKHVETEHVRQPVTVTRERLNVERRPVEGDARNSEVRMENGEIRIPIVEEELVVEKRAVVKEEVIVSKQTVEEQRVVEADLKRERFDMRDERERGRTGTDTPRRGDY